MFLLDLTDFHTYKYTEGMLVGNLIGWQLDSRVMWLTVKYPDEFVNFTMTRHVSLSIETQVGQAEIFSVEIFPCYAVVKVKTKALWHFLPSQKIFFRRLNANVELPMKQSKPKTLNKDMRHEAIGRTLHKNGRFF